MWKRQYSLSDKHRPSLPEQIFIKLNHGHERRESKIDPKARRRQDNSEEAAVLRQQRHGQPQGSQGLHLRHRSDEYKGE